LGKTEMLNIRIPATLKRLLTKRAKQKGQSVSAYVRGVLQKIDDYEETNFLDAISLVDEIDDEELLHSLAPLKRRERIILFCLLDSVFQELPISQTALARRSGVDAKYIRDLRQNEHFGKALSAFVFRGLRGYVDKIINHLYRQSAEGKFMATILLLELSGFYNPINRTMSMNVNVDGKDLRGVSAEAMREMVVNDWKRAGWTKEEFEKLWEGDTIIEK